MNHGLYAQARTCWACRGSGTLLTNLKQNGWLPAHTACTAHLCLHFLLPSLQGQTALWDAVLLFCARVAMKHKSIVRDLRLDNAALRLDALLPAGLDSGKWRSNEGDS